MKKILILFFTFVSISAFSQNADSTKITKFSDRINLGGSFGLMFGTTTNIDISPTVSYIFNKKFSAGIGVVYNYISLNQYNFRTNIYGGKIFANFLAYENIFLHAEYEILNLQTDPFDWAGLYPNQDRFYSESLFVGGGYRQYINEKSFFSIMILFDLNHNMNSFHENPLIRAGFNF